MPLFSNYCPFKLRLPSSIGISFIKWKLQKMGRIHCCEFHFFLVISLSLSIHNPLLSTPPNSHLSSPKVRLLRYSEIRGFEREVGVDSMLLKLERKPVWYNFTLELITMATKNKFWKIRFYIIELREKKLIRIKRLFVFCFSLSCSLGASKLCLKTPETHFLLSKANTF